MINEEFLNKYIPKKYHAMIESYSYDELDRYWVYLKSGWKSTDTDTRTIHEYTLKDLKKALKTIVAE